jgi:hypothetical protein
MVGGALDEVGRMGGAMAQRVAGRDMEVDERVHVLSGPVQGVRENA